MLQFLIRFAVCACAVLLLGSAAANAQSVPLDFATPPGGTVLSTRTGSGQDMSAPGDESGLAKQMAPVTIPTYPGVKPTIDGVLSPGEWTGAVELTALTRGVPQTSPLGDKVWMFNDACYLYIAAAISSPSNYAGYNLDGNATCINIWYDVDRDGQWDLNSPHTDGIISLPAPGEWYPPDVAAQGYRGLPGGWTTSTTGRMGRMVPWGIGYNNIGMGVVVPESEIFVRRAHPATGYHTVEARIDIRNSPLEMSGGVPVNMRIHWYSGYYTVNPYDGVQLIQGEWPSLAGDYYNGCYPNELDAQPTPTYVPPAPDPFDIVAYGIAENPAYNVKAIVQGDPLPMYVDFMGLVLPSSGSYTVNVYGPLASNALAATFSGNFNVNSPSGSLQIPLPVSLPRGFYRVELIVTDPDDCGVQRISKLENVLVLAPGEIPCEVWPGDVNRDDIVNYGDRAALNRYIFEADLRASWLTGPFRPAPVEGALGEFAWQGQAALPWSTAQGCHMDTDGNGMVNNFDYIGVKLNWMKTVSAVSPKHTAGSADGYMLEQNYPNPFNPGTTLLFHVPEASTVRLVVSDMSGRVLRTLVDGEVAAGSHRAHFDGAGLPSGAYMAHIDMRGSRSGATYTRTVQMTMVK